MRCLIDDSMDKWIIFKTDVLKTLMILSCHLVNTFNFDYDAKEWLSFYPLKFGWPDGSFDYSIYLKNETKSTDVNSSWPWENSHLGIKLIIEWHVKSITVYNDTKYV